MLSVPNRLAALRTLREGGVIAAPTEAVWGYSCDPWNPEAVARLLALKQRDPRKGLILVAASEAQLAPLIEPLDWFQRERLLAHWPGPYTFLVDDPHGWVPSCIKGRFSKVGVRVTAHPVMKALCEAWGGPLVSSSANRQGRPPARDEAQLRHVLAALEKRSDRPLVIPGVTGGLAQPTLIRDLATGAIVRQA